MTYELTVQQIKDYRVCELYYQFKYEDKEPEPILGREVLADKFEETLKRIVTFFFYKRQGYQTPSYNALMNRWEKLWFPKGTDAYDIAVEQHETAHKNIASYTTAAAASLLSFHEDFEDSKAEAFLIEESFLVPLDKDIRLSGVFNVILRQEDRYRVLILSGKQKRPSNASLTLDFAAQKFSFAYRNKDRNKVSFGLYDLASTRPGFVTFYPTKDHIRTLKYWAADIKNNPLYIPRRGLTTYCRGCPFDRQCAAWRFPDDV